MAAGLPPPHDSDGIGHASLESSITGRDVSVTTRSPLAREPSRPADRGKLADVSGSDPACNYSSYAVVGSAIETKASRKTFVGTTKTPPTRHGTASHKVIPA